MKRLHALYTVLMTTTLLLIAATVQAVRPQDGVYEKRDETGNVVARMYVVTLSGKGLAGPGQRSMKSAGGAPYITLEAYDTNGQVTEALATIYSWKTPSAGAGESGIRLTGENMRHSLEFGKKIIPERFSTAFGEQVGFSFPGEGEAQAYRCSPALDGTYEWSGEVTAWYPLAMILYAYEDSYNGRSFYKKELSSNAYFLQELGDTSYFGDYYHLTVSNPAKPDMWELTVEKNLHIAMESQPRDYRFLFVKEDYHGDPSWVGITWSTFTGTAMTSINALYLHRYLTLFAPEVLENPATFIRLTDFYSGEGPEAVTTNAFSVLLDKDGELMQLGKATVSDRGGEIRFRRMIGAAAIRGDGVQVRQAPDTGSPVLAVKNDGDPLTVDGFVRQPGEKFADFNWAKVRLEDGTAGYVDGQFIEGLDTP